MRQSRGRENDVTASLSEAIDRRSHCHSLFTHCSLTVHCHSLSFTVTHCCALSFVRSFIVVVVDAVVHFTSLCRSFVRLFVRSFVRSFVPLFAWHRFPFHSFAKSQRNHPAVSQGGREGGSQRSRSQLSMRAVTADCRPSVRPSVRPFVRSFVPPCTAHCPSLSLGRGTTTPCRCSCSWLRRVALGLTKLSHSGWQSATQRNATQRNCRPYVVGRIRVCLSMVRSCVPPVVPRTRALVHDAPSSTYVPTNLHSRGTRQRALNSLTH